MKYTTPSLALIARLADALGTLVNECETNARFADEHASEVEALGLGNQVHSEAVAFLKSVKDPSGNETALRIQLEDWDMDKARAPHHVQVTVSDLAVDVAIWPASLGDTPQGGLNVMIEVNQGMPAVHLAPANGEETSMHVHALPDGSIEYTRDSGADLWRTDASKAYPNSQAQVWKP